MESVRSTWTDSRLDDLNARFGELGRRLDALSERVDKLQHTMVQGFIAMFAAMFVGFVSLAGLIATQL